MPEMVELKEDLEDERLSLVPREDYISFVKENPELAIMPKEMRQDLEPHPLDDPKPNDLKIKKVLSSIPLRSSRKSIGLIEAGINEAAGNEAGENESEIDAYSFKECSDVELDFDKMTNDIIPQESNVSNNFKKYHDSNKSRQSSHKTFF